MQEVRRIKKHKNICLITVAPEASHPQMIARGFFTQCEKYGYNAVQFASMINLSFHYTRYKNGEENIYQLVNFGLFDGVVLDTVGLTGDENHELVEDICQRIKGQTTAPVICTGIALDDFDTVDNSNEQQIRQICRHAIEVHGCRKLCILTGFKGNHESEQRLSIILDEAERHGLTVDDEHIIYGDFWYTSGVKLAHDILDGRISKPDALIAVSDHMALGFIEEYTKLGGKVPEDICVVSFDATPEGMLDEVSLTSIESNYAKCAADAVDRIRSIIEPGEEIIPYEPDIWSMLHLGMSCGCPPDIHRTMDSLRHSIYFTARNYNADLFKDNIDIGLLMENYIPEQLTGAKDPEQCLELIHNMTYILSPFEKFFLCLCDDWLDTSADLVKGYPEKMRMALIRSNIDDSDFSSSRESYLFDTSLMLPQLFGESEEPSAFYFSAVHFSNDTLGYAVLQRKLSDYRQFNLVYRNWLRFVNTSLEMARSKNRFMMLSISDKMTGLLNRRGMYEQIDRLVSELNDETELFACVIDMDGLKYINDTFGHSSGDFGIRTVGKAALSITGPCDVCARAGGDEFYIAGIRKKGTFDTETVINAFCDRLKKLSDESGKPFMISASIGCAVSIGTDVDFEMLLTEADGNMYKYKMMRKRQRN